MGESTMGLILIWVMNRAKVLPDSDESLSTELDYTHFVYLGPVCRNVVKVFLSLLICTRNLYLYDCLN